jgi:hypothetical protein
MSGWLICNQKIARWLFSVKGSKHIPNRNANSQYDRPEILDCKIRRFQELLDRAAAQNRPKVHQGDSAAILEQNRPLIS